MNSILKIYQDDVDRKKELQEEINHLNHRIFILDILFSLTSNDLDADAYIAYGDSNNIKIDSSFENINIEELINANNLYAGICKRDSSPIMRLVYTKHLPKEIQEDGLKKLNKEIQQFIILT